MALLRAFQAELWNYDEVLTQIFVRKFDCCENEKLKKEAGYDQLS